MPKYRYILSNISPGTRLRDVRLYPGCMLGAARHISTRVSIPDSIPIRRAGDKRSGFYPYYVTDSEAAIKGLAPIAVVRVNWKARHMPALTWMTMAEKEEWLSSHGYAYTRKMDGYRGPRTKKDLPFPKKAQAGP